MNQSILYEDTLGSGCHWSMVMRRGNRLRLTDIHGGANVGMLMYNPADPLERINIPDTLKCQHTFRLSAGHCIYSDMGRVFCAIVDDQRGWHDAVGGTCNRDLVEQRWGRKTYQQAHNGMHRNGLDGFLIEMAKYGLGKRDLAANLNLFSKLAADSQGNLSLDKSAAGAGDSVELRFEMDTLVIMHTCPHPLDDAQEWPARPVHYQLLPPRDGSAEDELICQREENRRGLQNTRLYYQPFAEVQHAG